MSNYTKATNFTSKDSLPSGDSNKIVRGTEIDTELSAISAAIASKADSNNPAFTGTPTAPTAVSGTNTTQVATTAFVIGERTATSTLTNKTLTSPVVTGLTLNDSSIVFEGSTADNFETTLTVTDPTADRTITFPDKTGTVALTSDYPDTTLTSFSGTYTIAGTTMTVSSTAHGRAVNDYVFLEFTSGTAVSNYFTIASVPNANSFTVAYGSSLTTSGNVSGSYSVKGIISVASAAEVEKGTSTNRAVTPAALASKLPSFSFTGLSTSLSAGTDYTLPTDAIFVQGTGYFNMSGNSGSRMEVDIKDSSDTVIHTFILGGGNETNGTDGGSGMSTRDSFTILLPPNARKLTFKKGTGSNSISGQLEAVLTFSNYHS